MEFNTKSFLRTQALNASDMLVRTCLHRFASVFVIFWVTFVIDPVELIDVVTNRFEDLLQRLGFFDMLFKMASIIMDQQVWLYLRNLHSTHDHLDLVLCRLIRYVLHGRNNMPRMRVDDKLPSCSPVL